MEQFFKFFIQDSKLPRWALIIVFICGAGVTFVAQPLLVNYLEEGRSANQRVAEARLQDFRKLSEESQRFNTLLQSFTLDIQNRKPVKDAVRQELLSSLVKQYDNIKQFRVYVDPEFESPMADYQDALTNLKKQLVDVRSEKDLDAFYVVLAQKQIKEKVILPALESAAGKRAS